MPAEKRVTDIVSDPVFKKNVTTLVAHGDRKAHLFLVDRRPACLIRQRKI